MTLADAACVTISTSTIHAPAIGSAARRGSIWRDAAIVAVVTASAGRSQANRKTPPTGRNSEANTRISELAAITVIARTRNTRNVSCGAATTRSWVGSTARPKASATPANGTNGASVRNTAMRSTPAPSFDAALSANNTAMSTARNHDRRNAGVAVTSGTVVSGTPSRVRRRSSRDGAGASSSAWIISRFSSIRAGSVGRSVVGPKRIGSAAWSRRAASTACIT